MFVWLCVHVWCCGPHRAQRHRSARFRVDMHMLHTPCCVPLLCLAVCVCVCQTQRKLAPPRKHDPSPHPLVPEARFSTAAARARLELGASAVTIFGIVLRARVVLPRLWGLRTAV